MYLELEVSLDYTFKKERKKTKEYIFQGTSLFQGRVPVFNSQNPHSVSQLFVSSNSRGPDALFWHLEEPGIQVTYIHTFR